MDHAMTENEVWKAVDRAKAGPRFLPVMEWLHKWDATLLWETVRDYPSRVISVSAFDVNGRSVMLYLTFKKEHGYVLVFDGWNLYKPLSEAVSVEVSLLAADAYVRPDASLAGTDLNGD
jgi:hypothetical protein